MVRSRLKTRGRERGIREALAADRFSLALFLSRGDCSRSRTRALGGARPPAAPPTPHAIRTSLHTVAPPPSPVARSPASRPSSPPILPPRYKQQFTGTESAQKGLSMMKAAAHDPSMLMDSLNALKDPAMMAEVRLLAAAPRHRGAAQRVRPRARDVTGRERKSELSLARGRAHTRRILLRAADRAPSAVFSAPLPRAHRVIVVVPPSAVYVCVAASATTARCKR